MAAPSPAAWFEQLCARGRLAPTPAPAPLPPGNQDRRPELMRPSWRVRLADGRPAKLTVGASLGSLAERAAAFAAACPDIAATPLFRETLPGGEALGEAFFDGVSLDDAVRAGPTPVDTLRRAIAQVTAALAATDQASTEDAREAEWQTWARGLCELPVWTAGERDLLDRVILPGLRTSLAADPPVMRWTNGDFLAANLLVASDGRACLVDAEYAARTHFFREDFVRFRVLSGPARLRPDLVDGVLPEVGLDWHLFFWLRQLGLEAAQNTAEYLARVLPWRRAVIRRLAEHRFSLPLDGWSVPAAEIFHNIEDACWKPTAAHALVLAGWCHVPSAPAVTSVVVFTGDRRLAGTGPAPRPDVQAHFGGDPRALHSGFRLTLPLVSETALLSAVAICADGIWLPFAALRAGDLPVRGPLVLDYARWAAQLDPDPPPGAADGTVEFSVLLPVFNTPERLLRECVASVCRQHHPRWELIIVDDASPAPHVRPLIESLAARDHRIHLHRRGVNGGIARATNDALTAARHAFIVLLDHDDRLRPHALAELSRWIEADPAADVLYSDEEKISLEGDRVWPFFKPAFSPEFLLGVMYPGHALCVRTALARAAGGFDPAFDGVQDYEFVLRLTERTPRILHVPRVLYQWRLAETSSARSGNVKGDMDRLQADAVRAHLARRHDPRRIEQIGGHRLRLTANPATALPSVSLLVALGGSGLDRRELTTALGADAARVTEVLTAGGDDLPSGEQLRRLAAGATGDILVFLTCRPANPSPSWLAGLAAVAALDDSGAVAPLLLSAEDTVLESGWAVGMGHAGPLMRGFDAKEDGYNGSLPCDREVSAVSGLCLALRRDRYEKADGIRSPLDAPWWALDLCLRLDAAGCRNRVAAAVRIGTGLPGTGRQDRADGLAAFGARWPDRLARPDPYYNLHFEPAAGDYRLAARALYQPGPGAIPQPALQFHLDAPGTLALPGRFLRMHGWAFAPGTPLQGVQLQLPSMAIFGLYGTPRPDVPAALPAAPHGNVGFELWTRMAPGRHRAELQFQDAAGTWHDAVSLVLRVPRWTRSAWLPAGRPADLVAFQLGLCPVHAPRAIKPERFPALRPSALAPPRLAIVTPSFNHARFLPQVIASVAEASGIGVDHVVQDGGSSDGTVEVLRRYPASVPPSGGAAAAPGDPVRRFRWESAPDRGQADAIAKGFAQTSGAPDDLMAWINSDDFYLPGALAFVADYLARHPEVDVLYGNRVVVDERSQEIGRWYLPSHDDDVLRLNDFVPQETLFWRRRLWDRVGGIDPTLQFALDWDLLLRFQAAGARIVHVPYFLACFRVHAAQKTAAEMKRVGQPEIDRLRERSLGRAPGPAEIEHHPRLLAYLRRSAWIEFLAKFGLRA